MKTIITRFLFNISSTNSSNQLWISIYAPWIALSTALLGTQVFISFVGRKLVLLLRNILILTTRVQFVFTHCFLNKICYKWLSTHIDTHYISTYGEYWETLYIGKKNVNQTTRVFLDTHPVPIAKSTFRMINNCDIKYITCIHTCIPLLHKNLKRTL